MRQYQDDLTTTPFSISSSKYFKAIAGILAERYWPWIVFPLLLVISLAWFNQLFIVGFFMILCIIYPMLITLIYLYYVLTPEATKSVIPHYIKFVKNKIIIEYSPDKEGMRLPPDETIESDKIERIICSKDSYLFIIRDTRLHLVIVPLSSLGEQTLPTQFFNETILSESTAPDNR